MSKWFNETFLPSIFSRAGANNPIWLTRKQAAVCAENMKREYGSIEGPDGWRTIHYNYYTCRWQDRNVVVEYSSKNGCGRIRFSMTEQEQAEQERINEQHREQVKQERIERIKRNPERLAKEIEKVQKEISAIKEDIQIAIEEPIYDGEADELRKDLAEAENRLQALTA